MGSWGKRDTLGLATFMLEGVGFVLLSRSSSWARIVGAFLILAGLAPWLIPGIRGTIAAERARHTGADRHKQAAGLLKQGGVEQGDATDEAREEVGKTGVRH